MKRFSSALLALVGWLAVTPFAASVAHACPMCFAGGNENNDAFLVGSIFLMVVPVLTLGSLGYWAYRRLKASDDGVIRPSDEPRETATPAQNAGGNAVVLHLSQRR
jgi:hypothetical protein